MAENVTERRDNLVLGITAVVLAVFALSLGDAVIKAFSVSFPLWQLYVIRSMLALPLLFAVWFMRRDRPPLRLISVPWAVLRSLLLTSMWVAYYTALPNVELSLAAAAYYTAPLFIVLLAALAIGERVGLGGWFAVALGFAGVLVMLRPDAGDFNAYTLLPVVAAILYALAMILTRTRCLHEDPMMLAITLNITFVAVGVIAGLIIELSNLDASIRSANPFLLGPWTSLETSEWLALCALALAIVVGSVGAAVAYQAAPPSVVAVFDYCYLAFATVWGLLFFAELPGLLSLAGMAMIVVAGLVAIRR